MYIHNDDTQNYPFCTLKSMAETFETNQNLVKVTKVFKPTNNKVKKL